MNWNDFYKTIDPAHVARQFGKKSLADVLPSRATVRYVNGVNEYFPHGDVKNGDRYREHRYVDMGYGYFGAEPAFCSEANFCALVLLLDPVSKYKFMAHISAKTKIVDLEVDFGLFFDKIDNDLSRPELYIFRGSDPGVEELELAMDLFRKRVTTDAGLAYLGKSTYFIEGENGFSWRAYSSVYSNILEGRMRLDITFSRLGVEP